jgi:hypothetical protein
VGVPAALEALQINLLERVARDRDGMATKVNPPMRVALATVLILLGGCNVAQEPAVLNGDAARCWQHSGQEPGSLGHQYCLWHLEDRRNADSGIIVRAPTAGKICSRREDGSWYCR